MIFPLRRAGHARRPELSDQKPGAEHAHIPTPDIGGDRSADQPLSVHRRRALEQGRGRLSRWPLHIPWRGWKDVLWRTYNEAWNDRLFYVAAGVAFFVLLAVFPAISAIVSCYALIVDQRLSD